MACDLRVLTAGLRASNRLYSLQWTTTRIHVAKDGASSEDWRFSSALYWIRGEKNDVQLSDVEWEWHGDLRSDSGGTESTPSESFRKYYAPCSRERNCWHYLTLGNHQMGITSLAVTEIGVPLWQHCESYIGWARAVAERVFICLNEHISGQWVNMPTICALFFLGGEFVAKTEFSCDYIVTDNVLGTNQVYHVIAERALGKATTARLDGSSLL